MDARGFYNRYHLDEVHVRASRGRLEQRINVISKFIGDNCKLLEFGCGEGLVLNEISRTKRLDPQSYGLDISEVAVAKAQARFPHLKFVVIPETGRLPFDDGVFDVVVATEVIEHILDTQATFKELNRVLREGGTLILTTGMHSWLKDLLIILAFKHELHFHNPYSGHIRFYSKRSIKGVLKDFGFSLLHYTEVGKLPLIRERMIVIAKKELTISEELYHRIQSKFQVD